MMRKTQLFALIIVFVQLSYAQSKNEMWYRLLLRHNFNDKLGLDFDYHYRWQSDENNDGLFEYKLLDAWRFTVSYKLSNTFTLRLTPYSVWNSSGLVLQEQDKYRLPSNEKRWMLMLEHMIPLHKSISFQTRLLGEYRKFKTNEILRVRLRPQIVYINIKNQRWRMNSEILINAIGENTDFYDQSRATIDFTQPINKIMSIMAGYTYNYRPKTALRQPIAENIFLFTTEFTL